MIIISQQSFEMGQELWIRFVPERNRFGIKITTYFGEEFIFYADDVNISTVFPAKPRPGVTRMNVSTKGIIMKVSQPFVISGQLINNGRTMDIRLHHEK
ncbi:MAG: hypothetical protein ACTSPW_09020 [Promethearchaeota archaeon]